MSAAPPTCHAVSRSSELLSCARTALKIAQSSSANDQSSAALQHVSAEQLELHSCDDSPSLHSPVETLLEDGLALLRQMKQSLDTLSSLVKRRGHTNDPTVEISRALSQWEEDAKELSQIQIIPTPILNKQQAQHYKFVSAWLQAVAAQQASSLKEIMKIRGNVLQDQAQRRKLLNPSSKKKTSGATGSTRRSSSMSNRNSSVLNDSPLFTVTNNSVNGGNKPQSGQHALHAPPVARQSSLQPPPPGMNGTTVAQPSSAPSSYHGGGGYGGTTASSGYGSTAYGGSYGYGGTASYGGGGNMGMRQRKGAPSNTTMNAQQQEEENMHVQIQERQARRATKSRLENAQQAESKLAELGTLFGKMSTLISQQGEVLEKVEDDVEAAYMDVSAGGEEIQTLYSIKKGNRALILKVFGILIFFIIFMRLY